MLKIDIDINKYKNEINELLAFKGIELNENKKILEIEKINISFLKENDNFRKEIDKQKKSYNISNGYRIYKDYKKLNKVKIIRRNDEIRRDLTKEEISGINEINYKKINKIICSDSLSELKKTPSNSIDLTLTSPPYNFGLDYDFYNDSKEWKEYNTYMEKIIKELYRITKPGGRVVWNIQPLYSEYIPTHHIFYNLFLKNKFIWRNEIIWEKNNFTSRYTTWGSYMSPSSPYLKYSWEYILVFSKKTIKKQKINENQESTINAEDFKKLVYGKWSIAPEKKMKKIGHNAMFPLELARRVIELFSYKNDVILDPFNGAGTTTLVASELKRKYIGIDVSKKYCKIARERIKKDTWKEKNSLLKK